MPDYVDHSDEDPIGFDEATERSWRLYTAAFIEEVYPMFKEHGFTLAEASIIWELNRLKNIVLRLEEVIEDGS